MLREINWDACLPFNSFWGGQRQLACSFDENSAHDLSDSFNPGRLSFLLCSFALVYLLRLASIRSYQHRHFLALITSYTHSSFCDPLPLYVCTHRVATIAHIPSHAQLSTAVERRPASWRTRITRSICRFSVASLLFSMSKFLIQRFTPMSCPCPQFALTVQGTVFRRVTEPLSHPFL